MASPPSSQPTGSSKMIRRVITLVLCTLCGIGVRICNDVLDAPDPSESAGPATAALLPDASSLTVHPSAGQKRSAQAAEADPSLTSTLAQLLWPTADPPSGSAIDTQPSTPANLQDALDRLHKNVGMTRLSTASSLAPEPEPTLSVEVSELTSLVDGDDALFIGMLKNTSETPLDHPTLTITLWNADKTMQVGTVLGSIDRAVLPPGAQTSFKLLAPKLPPFAQLSSSVTLRPCLTNCRQGTLRVLSHKLVLRPPLLLLEGRVRNEDLRPLQFVKVIALLRDKQGQPRQQSYSFTSSRVLQPGQSAPFTMTFRHRTKPAKIDFDLEGIVADEPGDPSTLP